MSKNLKLVMILLIVTILNLFFFWNTSTPRFLTFSDGAKFADIARNIINQNGYSSSFSYSSSHGSVDQLGNGYFPAHWVPPLFPYSISMIFRLFGISDQAVVLTSSIFFAISTIALFFLSLNFFPRAVSFAIALCFSFNPSFLEFSAQGASETMLVAEMLISLYLISLSNTRARFLSLPFIISMYFTRPQGFIYIFGSLIYLVASFSNSWKKFTRLFLLVLVLLAFFERYTLSHISVNHFYSVTTRGLNTLLLFSSASANNFELRGEEQFLTSSNWSSFVLPILSKIFYNLYNFYKLIPQIIPVYLFPFAIFSFFSITNKALIFKLNLTIYIITLTTLFVTAASIPFVRYLHPLVPLIYLVSIPEVFRVTKLLLPNSLASTKISFLLLFLFCLLPTLTSLTIDSRHRAKFVFNTNAPPSYYLFSEKLEAMTSPQDIIVTNLDTWVSWYANRKSIWFPVYPKNIDPKANLVFITDYKSTDENYKMNAEWLKLLNHPESAVSILGPTFVYRGLIQVNSDQTYYKDSVKGVLFEKL